MASKLTAKERAFCRAFLQTRAPREAAAQAGFSVFPERAAAKLLERKAVREAIRSAEETACVRRAEIIAGYRRLAFGSVADAVRLMTLCDSETPPDPETLDLFCVAEIKRPKAGGLEIKFFDRQKALDRLAELQKAAADSALPFYQALERSAAALEKEREST